MLRSKPTLQTSPKPEKFGYECKALVLNPEIDKTHYHLIYATRDPTGVEVFK